MQASYKKAAKRPVIFLGVGIFNTLMDFAFYTFLSQTVLKSSNQIALVGLISGTFALLCAFGTHSYITWRDTKVSHKTLMRFLGFTGFGMWVIRPLLLALFIKLSFLYNWTHGLSQAASLPFTYNFIAHTGAFGFMVVIVLTYNYYVYSKFVFTSVRIDQENR
jgi:putative flippase GtrA